MAGEPEIPGVAVTAAGHGRGPVEHIDAYLEACCLELLGHHLRGLVHGLVAGVGDDHDLLALVAGLCQQFARPCSVFFVVELRPIGDMVGVAGVLQAGLEHVGAVSGDLHDFFHIEGDLQGAPDPVVIGWRLGVVDPGPLQPPVFEVINGNRLVAGNALG